MAQRPTEPGLLSLSLAAERAQRVPDSSPPLPLDADPDPDAAAQAQGLKSSVATAIATSAPASGAGTLHPALKHRRGSASGHRRRLSDAREAVQRPTSTAAIQAASALSTLSLSTSPSFGDGIPASFTSTTSLGLGSGPAAHALASSVPADAPPILARPIGSGSGGKAGKKRGTIFTCESCSKVYRHPSCLIKHRWEHTPHWREASKFVLSKHQQVQLLEAAAILSHISPTATGTSLPEDRSLWPSFLSGGVSVPASASSASSTQAPVSSSVPQRTTSAGPGPRLHDYTLPAGGNATRIRPGLVGVPTPSAAMPVPKHEHAEHVLSVSASPGYPRRTYAAYSRSLPSRGIDVKLEEYDEEEEEEEEDEDADRDGMRMREEVGTGGWSLPRSDVRSSSVSGSGSDSPEPREMSVSMGAGMGMGMIGAEDMDLGADADDQASGQGGFSARGVWVRGLGGRVKEEYEGGEDEDGWAGMDMDL